MPGWLKDGRCPFGTCLPQTLSFLIARNRRIARFTSHQSSCIIRRREFGGEEDEQSSIYTLLRVFVSRACRGRASRAVWMWGGRQLLAAASLSRRAVHVTNSYWSCCPVSHLKASFTGRAVALSRRAAAHWPAGCCSPKTQDKQLCPA